MTTQLDPSLIGSRVQPLQIADLLEQRHALQLRNIGEERQRRADAAEQAAMARRQQVGSMAAAGDYAGADNAALSAGDFDLHGHVAGLQDEHRKDLAMKVAAAAPVAFQAKQLPYEQRKAMIAQAGERLVGAGWKPEEIAAFDPTDANLDELVASSQSIDQLIGRYDKSHQPFTLGQDQKRFDERGNQIAAGPESIKAITTPEGGTTTILGGAGHTGIARGGASPVANAKTVAEGLFPGVRVTDNRRDANSKLGRANPGSWHVRSGGAVDVAPIKGMDFDQYVQGYRDAGYEIIEARDEVKNPSGHATGPHWHVVIGGKPEAGAMVIHGKPKPKYRQFSPEEAKGRGLPEGSLYQMSPDGQVTAIGGQTKLKLPPPKALTDYQENRIAMKPLQQAIQLLDPKNNSPAAKAARGAIGPTTGMLGERFSQYNSPEGTSFRALLGKISGVIIKDISGAAVTAAEDGRLSKWVPLVTDTPDAARAKLRNLQNAIGNYQQSFDDIYNEDNGYRPIKLRGGSPQPAAPVTKGGWGKAKVVGQ